MPVSFLRDDRPARQPLIRLAHHGSRVAPLFVAGALTCWSTAAWASATASALRATAAAVGIAGILAYTGHLLVHRRRLCLACHHDAPLSDPQAAVHRYRRRLRWHHRSLVRAVTGLVAPVIVAMDLQQPDAPRWIRIATTLPALAAGATYAYLLRAADTHRQLEHWCPGCNLRRPSGSDPT
ncbi:anthrone oxygenase family protein [Actinoplanes octamycinicus]|uniref:anthrone oxygenase family protein n=1 Tax=Actinoplanes octamycinicus TaxID=135948 RepID=UPI0016116CF1